MLYIPRRWKLPDYQKHRDRVRRKRNAKEHVNFLNVLPRELRDHIWTLALEPLTRKALHPYDNHWRPRHSRFKSYINLRLVCRQVSAEIEDVFRIIAPEILFYCIHVPQLFELRRQIVDHPVLKDAKFHIRTPTYLPHAYRDDEWPSGIDDPVSKDVERLIRAQPGYAPEWASRPGFYQNFPEQGWTDWMNEVRYEVDLDEEELADEGFAIRKVASKHCNTPSDTAKDHPNYEGCEAYHEIVYPQLDNGMHLVCLTIDDGWETLGPEPIADSQWGCTVMEGKFKDVRFVNDSSVVEVGIRERYHLFPKSGYSSDESYMEEQDGWGTSCGRPWDRRKQKTPGFESSDANSTACKHEETD